MAVSEMDHVTQQNASKVQSISSAAQRLTNEALDLANVIAAFRLEGAGEESSETARQRLSRDSSVMPSLSHQDPSQQNLSQKNLSLPKEPRSALKRPAAALLKRSGKPSNNRRAASSRLWLPSTSSLSGALMPQSKAAGFNCLPPCMRQAMIKM